MRKENQRMSAARLERDDRGAWRRDNWLCHLASRLAGLAAAVGKSGAMCLLMVAATAAAQDDAYVPEALEDWRQWALHGHEYRRCPFLYNSSAARPEDFVCAWPGVLKVTVDEDGGTFEQAWTVHAGQWIALPGDAETWPRQVTRNGQPAEVVLRQDAPAVWLEGGEHRLAGRFGWTERPSTLPVAAQAGLIALAVDGKPVAIPRRDEDLWLAPDDSLRKVQDELTAHVYRRVLDDVPTRLETVLALSVGGSVREERFAPALPAGFVPLALNGDLPARLAADGDLRVQVRPGYWEVAILARAATTLNNIAMPAVAEGGQDAQNMPDTEIWSYQANPTLRATVAEAAHPVDPDLVDAQWPRLPAFRLRAGERLAIDERRRGQANTRNDLSLRRQLWLDFDGAGFTFLDDIAGTMRADWRLDVVKPYALLAVDDDGQELVVTRNEALADSTGVEVRNRDLNLRALGRIDSRGAVPAGGWRSSMDVQATLNLPPGNKLLAAFGVDAAPQSWIGKWRLLDFFVLLIVAVASVRLFGRAMGAVALLALTLSYHEAMAPVWSWLNLLAAVALARVAPAGRLQRLARGYRLGSLAILLLFLIPFATTQIRVAMYPQLEPESHRHAQTVGLFEALAGGGAFTEDATGADVRRTHFDVPEASTTDVGRQRLATARPLAKVENEVEEMIVDVYGYQRYDQAALTQTGPGVPAWQWTPYELTWQGPVAMQRDMRLLIAPAWLTGLWRLLAVTALGVFAARFALEVVGKPWRWPAWRRTAPATLALALAAATLGDAASAETPAPEILDELQERLLAPPACAPNCAEVAAAVVSVDAEEIAIQLRIHALRAVAVPLPGAVDGWQPSRVALAGAALPVRQRDNALWVHVSPGLHELSVRGPLPDAETVEIPFAAPPRTIDAASEHWFIEGIRDGTLPTGSLALTRLRREAEQGPPDWQTSRFPTFVRIERTLHLQPLDWRVETKVHRVAPAHGATSLDVPLIAGETVVSSGLEVRNGNVRLALPAEQEAVGWQSSLPMQTSLSLAAAVAGPWQEIWRLAIGSSWQVTFTGVPPSQQPERAPPATAATDVEDALMTFHPRPGETLSLAIARPTAVPGTTLAFDDARLEVAAGAASRESRLQLSYRSTRGGSHEIRLPENAELGTVTTDGVAEPLALHDGVLDVPILPGQHRMTVAWLESTATGLRVRTPEVDLGAAAGNIVSALEMPSRWLLFVDGPALGPAVLYWSELIALVVVSLILGRVGFTPLRTVHWLLLGLGFSTFSWLAFATVAAWLLAHGTRQLWSQGLSRLAYNLSQIGFGLLTLLAFAAILAGIPSGLLGNPDMSVTGFGSSGQRLLWFADKTAGAMPQASVWSLPLWTYKALILAWALWLSFALVRWLPWVWQCFAARGLWLEKKIEDRQEKEEPLGDAASKIPS